MHNSKCFASHLGLWAIEPEWMRSALAAAKAGTLKMYHDDESPEDRAARDDKRRMAAGASKVVRDERYYVLYEIHEGVAIMDMTGPMAKFDSKYGGVNTVRARQAVRKAVKDEDAAAIILQIDSPGGNVAGTKELADDVAAADKVKPVYAFIEDTGASAAYWVAAQTRRIYANEMALVGSIGTYMVMYDESKAAEMNGVKVHVIGAGELKGTGEPGTPVTPEQVAYAQELVDDFNAKFLAGVGAGRAMEPKAVKDVATGRVWIAAKAKKLGLIDEISSFQDMFNSIKEKAAKKARARAAEASVRLAEIENV